MDRLTTSDWGSIVCGSCTYLWPPNGCLLDDPCPRKLIRDCMKRLGAYEDTGLSPEEADALRERLAQYEIDIAKGRLVRVPCKPGQTLYWVEGRTIFESKILSFHYDEYGQYCKSDDGDEFSADLYNECLGESVFLTLAEAEAALERVKQP